MKFKQILIMVSALFLLSCNDLVKEKNIVETTPSLNEEKHKKVQIVDVSGFVKIIDALPDIVMRKEATVAFQKLQLKYDQAEKIPLASITLFFENLIENNPLLQHDKLFFRLSKEYNNVGKAGLALSMLDKLLSLYPDVEYVDKVYFYKGNILFYQHQYAYSVQAFNQVIQLKQSSYYEQAVYKQGWAYFKQTHYGFALNSFMHLLDVHSRNGELYLNEMSLLEKKSIENIFQAINIGFDALAGSASARDYFNNKQKRQYEYYVFLSLADFYQKKGEINEAIKTYRKFVEMNNLHIESPGVLLKTIELYEKLGFDDELIEAKKYFVQKYSVNHTYWRLYSNLKAAGYFVELKRNLIDLANYYYAKANDRNSRAYYRQAQRWHRVLLNSFPDSLNSQLIRYQLAELLKKSESYEMAALQFENVAYDFELNAKAAEAGYAALIMYKKRQNQLQGFAKKHWHKQYLSSAQRFLKRFPNYPKKLSVTVSINEEIYDSSAFDKVVKLFSLRKWREAELALESFRYDPSHNQLRLEVTKKLAWVYWELRRLDKAAIEFEALSQYLESPLDQVNALWFAAELSELNNKNKQAEKIMLNVNKYFTISIADLVEAQQWLIEIYDRSEEPLLADQMRVKLVNAEVGGKKLRTKRTGYLAAKARMVLAERLYEQYRKAILYTPLDNSLKIKTELMNKVLNAYQNVVVYKAPEVLSSAIYKMAELNRNMSFVIINAEVPSAYNENERKQFAQLLKMKAQPFVDKEIYFHEKNMSSFTKGFSDIWVGKSLQRLKLLLPERYGKAEHNDVVLEAAL